MPSADTPTFNPDDRNCQLINVIAPALRGFLAGDSSVLPVVAFDDSDSVQADAKTLPAKFDPAGLNDDDKIIEALGDVIKKYRDAHGRAPEVVAVAGLGVFSVEADCGTPGRARGKVVIVTGAAQGFGLEIATGLAEQGSNVVLADINADGARAAALKIEKQFNRKCAMGLAMNVTDGQSIADALHQVVRRFGGFDAFISNAGVLRAESVKTQPENDFDFVTNVNYKGFFLCVQKASAVLVNQHKARADYRSDIIQINSKSGLVGSNRNAAYAGSKFGGLGLVQSFAMELIEDGVKVNAICPGNFFDGPLWSDPENGLFVQYLRTGKIPGAKTIEDVRKGYEAKVPMGRGCTTPDVMQAVFYLMDQKYETGQAMPVTGGQVMLS